MVKKLNDQETKKTAIMTMQNIMIQFVVYFPRFSYTYYMTFFSHHSLRILFHLFWMLTSNWLWLFAVECIRSVSIILLLLLWQCIHFIVVSFNHHFTNFSNTICSIFNGILYGLTINQFPNSYSYLQFCWRKIEKIKTTNEMNMTK